MHESTLTRLLPLAVIAFAAALAPPVLAQDCAGASPNFFIFRDSDGVVYTGDRLRASIQAAPGATLTSVTVTVNGTTAVTQTTFPAPEADGRVIVEYELVVDADKAGAIRLPPSAKSTVQIRATDSLDNCAQAMDLEMNTRSPGTFAVVVGINEYPSAQSSLQFARKDAEAVAQHLIDNVAKVDPTTVFLLTDPVPPGEVDRFPSRGPATRDSILRALATVAKRVDTAGSIIFYYSGHGFATKATGYRRSHFMLMYDSSLTDDVSMLSISDIIDLMNGAPGERKVLIVDACFSDGVVTGFTNPAEDHYRIGRAFGPVRVLSDIAELIGHPNNDSVYVMTSSSGDQLSYEIDDLGHGAFTYYLLQSSAQTPPVADVTIDRAYTFAADTVEERVLDLLQKVQRPRHWAVGDGRYMVWKKRSSP